MSEVENTIKKVETNLQPPNQLIGAPGSNIFDRMKDLHVPNVSITVIRNGKIEWTREYKQDNKNNTQETSLTTSVFQAASISKTINAVLAMKVLVESKMIDLDEDVNPYLKGWKIPNDTFDEKVTLRQLLSHTAGTTVHGFCGYHSGNKNIPTAMDVLIGNPALKDHPPSESDSHNDDKVNSPPVEIIRKPGESFSYSGGGATVVQKLIEDMTGKRYADLAKQYIFDPLGMTSSTFEFQLPEEAKDDFQKGHLANGEIVDGDWRLYPELAAAGLWTTSKDLAVFAMAIQNAYLGNENTWMSVETARIMLTQQANSSPPRRHPSERENPSHGLGFVLDGKGNNLEFGHSGANEGFQSDYVVFPLCVCVTYPVA